tara:strand:+ start:238 stop:549 length:312 start_codon:yes stop_codon:yes gene_type:complete
MYTVITKFTVPFVKFKTKDDFKKFLIREYVPLESDEFRQYNYKMMEKYGHHFFRLEFIEPHTGWLFHTYQSEEDYKGSIDLRLDQQKKCEQWGFTYEIFYPNT